jgi:mannose-6-phosphate isomerase-like protein (cupin superfamily)
MFGPISNDAQHCGTTRRLIGGDGTCQWKTLINGMHLNGNWNVIEYLHVPPGASIGTHTHLRTEEIYYITSGRARMDVNGTPVDVAAGDLVTNPIYGRHGIANPTVEDMTFYVVEVFPAEDPSGYSPERIPIHERLENDGNGIRQATVDLAPKFSGDWGSFTVLELAPGSRVGPVALNGLEQVLHVVRGAATVDVDGEAMTGAAGLTVSVPPGVACSVENVGRDALEIAITEVRAQPAPS